jgi:hypothetical protein
MIVARARRVAKAAGLDPQICFLHAHNAMASLNHGKPWPGVDYDLVRKVLYLQRLSWKPHRLLQRWDRRRLGLDPNDIPMPV